MIYNCDFGRQRPARGGAASLVSRGTMHSYIRMGTALAVALSLPACATVTRGTSQKFVIESAPSGAAVKLSTGQTCTTPCSLKMKRKKDFTAKFAKEGYQSIEANVESRTRAGGTTALVGNVLIGGIVGAVIDSNNGSANDLRPNPLRVTLAPLAAGPIDAVPDDSRKQPLAAAQFAPSTPTDSKEPPSTGVQAYRISKGDKVKISTFGEDRFSGEFTVHGDGKITFPLFGDIQAADMTTPQLAEAIAKRLVPDYLRDPRVTAEVISFRPVYILGEVARPGQYAYVEGMTMYALIAQAGGLSYRANRKFAHIRHENEANEQQIIVESTTPISPGDTVRIGQRIF